ncbi:hypothetical protein SKAU_G00109390 [Synaphobranchus kaupii]|uniref:SOCS box domain-containing protein n=1 Tax=Synaphobranchus kaupii TaxID=118154 RepID=A0A9Q1G179_SYNKA|nr:hypothetical protein SKAU_G00109390 [Synaphobranchus kaupii]
MILCVQGPRALLPVPTTEVVPFTMRTDTHIGFSSSTTPCCLHSPSKLWGPHRRLACNCPDLPLPGYFRLDVGPTNVRIEYSHGRFRLDSSSLAKPRLLAFPDVASLVQHYVGSSQGELGCKEDQPIPKDSALLLKLARPLHRRKSCPSLHSTSRGSQLTRLACRPDQLPLPRPLQHYLQDYPFHL